MLQGPQGQAETQHRNGLSPRPHSSAGSSSGRGVGLGSLTHLCVPGSQHRPGPELAIGDLVVSCSQLLGADRQLWGSLPFFWACGCITVTTPRRALGPGGACMLDVLGPAQAGAGEPRNDSPV